MARFAPLVIALALVAACLPACRAQVDVQAIINQAVAQAQAQGAVTSTSSSTSSSSSSSSTSASSALVGGVSPDTCATLAQTESATCANGQCCNVAQKVTACDGWITGEAAVNGAKGTCCVVLLNARYKYKPSLFCTRPYQKGVNYQISSAHKVRLVPNCNASSSSGSASGLSCEVAFNKLPDGWVLPKATDKPVTYKIKGSTPCFGPFKSFTQITKDSSTAQSRCI